MEVSCHAAPAHILKILEIFLQFAQDAKPSPASCAPTELESDFDQARLTIYLIVHVHNRCHRFLFSAMGRIGHQALPLAYPVAPVSGLRSDHRS